MNLGEDLQDINLVFKARDIDFKLRVNRNETFEQTQKKIRKILSLRVKDNFDFYIENFHVGEFFNGRRTISLMKNFGSDNLEIKMSLLRDDKEVFDYAAKLPKSRRRTDQMINQATAKSKLALSLFDTDLSMRTTNDEFDTLKLNLKNYLLNFGNKMVLNKSNYSDSFSLNSMFNRNFDENEETCKVHMIIRRHLPVETQNFFQICR